jgi:hypothetical protein
MATTTTTPETIPGGGGTATYIFSFTSDDMGGAKPDSIHAAVAVLSY